jgi:hypothetical protein
MRTQRILLALCAAVGACAADSSFSYYIGNATNELFNGRAYLVGFPKSRTRNDLRNIYLDFDPMSGVAGANPLGPVLQQAVSDAVSARLSPDASPDQLAFGQTVAWEALEAYLNGQLIVGNADLLDGLRVAFPSVSGGGQQPVGDKDLPIDTPVDQQGAQYSGVDLRALVYAKHYFFDGIAATLDFMATDPDGTIRAFDAANAPLTEYTEFNTPELPDPNFAGAGVQSMETAGYLTGNILDAYGKATLGLADHLWKGAFFDRLRAPGGARASDRGRMLDQAVNVLHEGAHAQFLAVLPLAATVDEGDQGFTQCRLDQARVTAATAAAMIDKIRRGEAPKLTSFSLNASTDDIKQTLGQVNQLKATAAAKYQLAQTAIWRVKDAENNLITQAQQIRSSYNDQLIAAVGIDPGDDNTAPYYGLSTEIGRRAYRSAVAGKVQTLMAAPPDSPLLTDGTEIGTSILAMLRSFNDLKSAQNKRDAIPQQVAIEEQKTQAQDQLTFSTQQKVSGYNSSIAIVNSLTGSVGNNVSYKSDGEIEASTTISLSFSPNPIIAAGYQNDIAIAQAVQMAQANDITSSAAVKNLLLQQVQLNIDMQSAALQARSALAGVNTTLAKVNRIIQSQISYRTSNQQRWYSDPAIIFEQEQEEIDYQNALQQYVDGLFVLAQKLAVRWSEPYQNPYLAGDGSPTTLGSADYDGFTQPESIFAVAQNSQADSFLDAMRDWDLQLRSQRQGGQADIQSKISLRQDIFGFSDIIYDTNKLQFVTNPDAGARALNVQRFRALLLANQKDASSPYLLRMEFPITYGQYSRAVVGQAVQQPALILVSRSDWNVRVTELSAVVTGQNVAQSAFNTIRLDLIQYGKLEIPTYFPRQTAVYPNFLTFSLPLYYSDPEVESVSTFKFSLNAGINGQAGVPNPFVATAEPTPFCDRYVLLIEKAANPPINLQNIEDIQLTLKSRSSIPPTFFN